MTAASLRDLCRRLYDARGLDFAAFSEAVREAVGGAVPAGDRGDVR